MDLAEAKQNIVAYLAGQALPGALLEQAWAAVQQDRIFLARLAEEAGLPDTDACAVFRARVAEFAELSAEERHREVPELAAHVVGCASCLSLLWRVQPMWRSDGVGRVRSLVEPIRLALSLSGGLRRRGMGVQEVVRVPLAKAAGPRPPSSEGDRKEWLLEDPETGGAIRLIVRGVAGGRIEVRMEFTSLSSAGPRNLEVRERPRGTLYLAGPLADFAANPLVLGPGDWLLALEVDLSGNACVWKLPLILEWENDNGS